MASLNKLAIRGIRSFDDKSIAVIEFFSPVTVIVGPNGSGKTTIIECLKYATTGDHPPNTRGGAFVHDPKMANEKEVKAQVKLRFHAANGTRMLAVRNLSVTVKKTNGLTMKTLEGILSIAEGDGENSKGKRATISTKCAEMDTEIPQLLGVSKSVLDNVIFCHQEESWWPLAEASALKKKFDDIFEATKYTKALDSIKSLRKDRATELKGDKDVLAHLAIRKSHADKLKRRLAEANRNIAAKEVEIEHAKKAYDELHMSNIKFQQYATHFREQYLQIQNLEEQKGTFKTQLAEMRTIMKTELTGSDEELFDQLQNFSEATETLKQKQKTAKNRLAALEADREKARDKLKAIDRQQAGLEAQSKSQEERIQEREAIVVEIGRQYGIKGYETSPLPAERVTEFNDRLTELRRQHKSKLDSVSKTLYKNREEYSKKLRGIDAQLSDLRSEKKVLEEKTAKHRDHVKKLNLALENLQSVPGQISSLEREMEEKKAGQRRVQSEAAEAQNERRIRELDVQKSKLEDSRQVLLKEMTALGRQAESRARLGLRREEAASKSKELKRILEDCAHKYRRLVGSDPRAEDMEENLTPLISEKTTDCSDAEKQSASAEKDLNNDQSSLNNLNAQLKSKKRITEGLDQKLAAFDVIQQSEEEPFASIQDAIKNYTDCINETSNLIATQGERKLVYEQLLKKSEERQICETCDQDIQDMDAFRTHLGTHIAKASSDEEVETYRQEIADWTATLKTLQPLVTAEKEKQQLLSEIPELERQKEELDERIRIGGSTVEQAFNKVTELKQQLKDFDSLKIVAKDVNRLSKDIASLRDEISNIEADLLATGSTKTQDDVKKELDDLIGQIHTLDQSRGRMVDEQTRHSNDLRRYTDDTNKMSYELADLRRRLSEKEKTEEALEMANEENTSALAKLKDFERKVSEAEDPKRELEREHKATAAELEVQKTELEQTGQELNRAMDRLQSSNQAIQRFVRERLAEKLHECQEAKEDAEGELKGHTRKVTEATASVEALNAEVSSGDATLANLHQNIQCRKLAKEIAVTQERINKFDMEEAAKARRNFDDKYPIEKEREGVLHAKLSHLGGELSSQMSNLGTIENDLSDFKDIYKEYTNQLIKVKMSDMANNDLDKYAKALDSAIMKYHSLKMEEVNDTMKHLWNKTYQGTDIDGIRIRADSEGGTTKRTYNYRVVMVKDQVEMDMRGRCSAGQKMLASIIIRLALSDSFGQNCGILALDEPTNALDTENIDALASSLVDIINERKNHSSFQLVIITHDEGFLRKLGQSDVMEFYWRVSRDARQKSVIERQRFI